MYTILLADDEENVLNALRLTIPWQEMGVGTILTAQDGQAALSLLDQHPVDLLIADIRMPRMDGIALIAKAREFNPDTHCILLTAYGEFDYARQAIQLGVEGYLLKPIVKEEIEQTVRQALSNLYQHRRTSEKLLLENTLRRWASGEIGAEELGERATVLGLNLYQASYAALCMVKRGRESVALFRTTVAQLLRSRCDVNGFWDEKGHYVMILGASSLEESFLAETVREAARQTGAEGQVVAVLGPVVSEAEVLHRSVQVAIETLELADLQHCEVWLTPAPTSAGLSSDVLCEELRMLFYQTEAEARADGYHHLAHKLLRGGWSTSRGDTLVRACVQVFHEEFPLRSDWAAHIWQTLAPVRWPADPAEAEDACCAFLQQAQQEFSAQFAARSPIVQHTIQLIRDSVMNGESISLKELCALHSMNPAYLGHLFKTETGVFFNDYLTQCRIERAVILLRNPNRKVREIAEEIGFSYVSYFVKCFRSAKGRSPNAYRQELLQQENTP